MGGWGSGCSKGKPLAEQGLRFDIRELKRSGCLELPFFTSRWTRGGRQRASISVEVSEHCLTLVYNHNKEPVRDTVNLTTTPCNYGGRRVWFLCPGCGRRVAVLFAPGKYFRCRHCWRITYESRNEEYIFRLISKRQKIRDKLGLPPGSFGVKRPKGMHKTTYVELRCRLLRLEFDWCRCANDQFNLGLL